MKRGRSTEQMPNDMLSQIPPPELDIQNGSIYAKVTLHRGFQIGPYPIKWTNDPMDKNVAWEVSDYKNNLHSFFFIELVHSISRIRVKFRRFKEILPQRNRPFPSVRMCFVRFRIINQSTHSSTSSYQASDCDISTLAHKLTWNQKQMSFIQSKHKTLQNAKRSKTRLFHFQLFRSTACPPDSHLISPNMIIM